MQYIPAAGSPRAEGACGIGERRDVADGLAAALGRHGYGSAVVRIAIALLLGCCASATDIRVHDGLVEVLAGGRRMLSSPPEGLWTIACDWRDSWPAGWQTARPGAPETVADWTI